jgi:hypothetical protein
VGNVNQQPQPSASSAFDQRHIAMTNAVVHLWLAIEYLEGADVEAASADIRAIMEGLGEKHNLPVIEADAYANYQGGE